MHCFSNSLILPTLPIFSVPACLPVENKRMPRPVETWIREEGFGINLPQTFQLDGGTLLFYLGFIRICCNKQSHFFWNYIRAQLTSWEMPNTIKTAMESERISNVSYHMLSEAFWGPPKSDFSTLLPELPKAFATRWRKSFKYEVISHLHANISVVLGQMPCLHSQYELYTCISLKTISLTQCSPWGNESHLRVVIS